MPSNMRSELMPGRGTTGTKSCPSLCGRCVKCGFRLSLFSGKVYGRGTGRLAKGCKHQSLAGGQIRLLKLFRRSPLAYVTRELVHVFLDSEDLPTYEAISYHWGEDSPRSRRAIIVNNQILMVAQSAFRALHDCTSAWRTRLLWIDSVCINQGDDIERSRQVAMMRDIYSKAS